MREITVKYEGECSACGAVLELGTRAMYEKTTGIFCVGCEPTDPEEIRKFRTIKAEYRASRKIGKAERLEREAAARVKPKDPQDIGQKELEGEAMKHPANKNGFGPFSLSYNEARAIQDRQYIFYTRHADDYGKAKMREMLEAETAPCLVHPDVPMSIFKINDMVPRGGWFEGPRQMKAGWPSEFPRQFVTGI